MLYIKKFEFVIGYANLIEKKRKIMDDPRNYLFKYFFEVVSVYDGHFVICFKSGIEMEV